MNGADDFDDVKTEGVRSLNIYYVKTTQIKSETFDWKGQCLR